MAAMANVLIGIHCVVPGCRSTLKKVNQWKARPCVKPKHSGKVHAQCMCPEPYQFFKFPVEIKLQKIWQERVNRPDLEINNLTRVCSLHFAEGRPTRRHYFPDLNLRGKSVPTKRKEERTGTVSIVPMELLQDSNEDNVLGEDSENDEGSHLSISRYGYNQDEENYDAPAPNTVTITRVSPAKARENLATTSGSQNSGRNDEDDSDCPFDIEMVGDDEVEDEDMSSDLSDGIEMIQYSGNTGSNKPVVASRSTGSKTLVFVTSAGSAIQNPKNSSSTPATISKSKLLPTLAAAPPPKFQVPGTGNGSIPTLQPIITKISSTNVVKRPVPTLTSSSPVVRNAISTTGNGVGAQKEVSPAVVATGGSGGSPAVNGNAATTNPVATYDPSKQQLQIANPVKYIQDCHNRIAELLSEKQALESKMRQLESKNRQLEARNKHLESKQRQLETKNKLQPQRQIVTVSQPDKPQFTTPTFNLIPSLSQVMSVSGNSVSTVSSNNVQSKPRISYVIRRQP